MNSLDEQGNWLDRPRTKRPDGARAYLTVRDVCIATAMLALVFWSIRMAGKSERYSGIASGHRYQLNYYQTYHRGRTGLRSREGDAREKAFDQRLDQCIQYEKEMVNKYWWAALTPWRSLEPDPPDPGPQYGMFEN
jgi:hypothetical protein